MKRRERQRGEEAESEIDRLPSSIGDSFTEFDRGELNRRLRAALDELTSEHRAVILLREVEGLSYDEISDILHCPRGTVMSRLHYARNRLRTILKTAKQS